MLKVIQMLKCLVNSVFKDFIPKDAVETSTEESEDEGVLMQYQKLQELYERMKACCCYYVLAYFTM